MAEATNKIEYIVPCNMDNVGRVLIPAMIRNKLNINSLTNLTLCIIDGKVVIQAVEEPETA